MESLVFHAIALLQMIAIVIRPGVESLTGLQDSGGRKCRDSFASNGPQMCNQVQNKISCACTCDDDCRAMQSKVHDCCKDQGVASTCLELCRYDVNFNELTCQGENCANEVPTWMSCAAAGRNNIDCCRAKLINPICDDLCAGQTPKDIWNGYTYLPCIMRIQEIMECHQQGLQKPADGPMVNPGAKEPIPDGVKWASQHFCVPS